MQIKYRKASPFFSPSHFPPTKRTPTGVLFVGGDGALQLMYTTFFPLLANDRKTLYNSDKTLYNRKSRNAHRQALAFLPRRAFFALKEAVFSLYIFLVFDAVPFETNGKDSFH